jgi:hypothetical protein
MTMAKWQALGSGAVGACVLTLLHESVRRRDPHAPRMDVMGMRAIAKSLRKVNRTPPPDKPLHRLALVGDLVSNSLYYSMVGDGKDNGVWLRGALLGLNAGLGAVILPSRMGLGRQPDERTPKTQVMTVAWYFAGGLAAAAAARLVATRSDG